MVVNCATQPYFHGFLIVNELHFLLFHYEAQDKSKHIIDAGISSYIATFHRDTMVWARKWHEGSRMTSSATLICIVHPVSI
jgi:hypothetical protein